ncbi:MAG TPA: alanine racemase [Frankiaceae bacterium]|nr:alanine racemase [Frankiaceae bacterium]
MTAPRAEAVVDLAAIKHNVGVLRTAAGGAEVLAAVKADAYGHGLVPVARAVLDGGATWLGVALVEEGVALRAAGVEAPVLVLVEPPPGAGAVAAAYDLDLGVGTPASLGDAVSAGARVHLKADTGLARGGAVDFAGLAAAAVELGAEVVGVWSHLACADDPLAESNATQLARFEDALRTAAAAGVTPRLRHLSNSAATLTMPRARYDLVRPGIAVYGLTPVPGEDFGLRPAMTLRARVAMTKRVPGGTGVSYGHRYRTAAETTLALVPAGYGDGVPRHASNAAPVWVAGARRTVSGTVCMDQFVVDVGDAEVAAGDEVVLFGPGARGEPTAQDWADALGTISYEIVTRIGARVPRRYVG